MTFNDFHRQFTEKSEQVVRPSDDRKLIAQRQAKEGLEGEKARKSAIKANQGVGNGSIVSVVSSNKSKQIQAVNVESNNSLIDGKESINPVENVPNPQMSGLAAFRQSQKINEPQNAINETMADIPEENNADKKQDLNHRASVVHAAQRRNNHQDETPRPRNSRQALSVGRAAGKGGNKVLKDFQKKKEGRHRRGGKEHSADSRPATPLSFKDNIMA